MVFLLFKKNKNLYKKIDEVLKTYGAWITKNLTKL